MFTYTFEYYSSGKTERSYIDDVNENEAKKQFIKRYGPIAFKVIDTRDLDVLDETLDELEDFEELTAVK